MGESTAVARHGPKHKVSSLKQPETQEYRVGQHQNSQSEPDLRRDGLNAENSYFPLNSTWYGQKANQTKLLLLIFVILLTDVNA